MDRHRGTPRTEDTNDGFGEIITLFEFWSGVRWVGGGDGDTGGEESEVPGRERRGERRGGAVSVGPYKNDYGVGVELAIAASLPNLSPNLSSHPHCYSRKHLASSPSRRATPRSTLSRNPYR